MQTEDLKNFFVWCVITCHLTTYQASRNRFFAISFHDYLHYCGIFLARFLIKIDLNIISSLHIVFARELVGVMSVQNYTNAIKVAVDLNEMTPLTRATLKKKLKALHVVRNIIFCSGLCLFCGQKCGPRPKLFLRLDIFSTLVDHIILTHLRKSFIPDNKIK